MKQLGIFGDSYAEIRPPADKWPWLVTGWSYRFKKELGEKCGVHAGGGSSHLWNFRQFLENHAKYQQVIFVITNLHRISMPVKITDKQTGKSSIQTHFPSYKHIEFFMEKYHFEHDLGQKMLDYLVYISKPLEDSTKDVHMATVKYIQQVRPDAIIVPAFPTITIGELGLGYDWCLTDIDWNERRNWFDRKGMEPWIDPRPNHFTPKSSNWVYEHMKARLRGEFIQWNNTLTPSYNSEQEFNDALTNFAN